MTKNDIKLFLEKNSQVFTNRGFRFKGVIKNIGDTCLIIDDRFKGLLTIELCDIKDINEVKEW